ncbi:MAG: EF2563 family selenium-dependent molybdenum hydroxylase system protein [Planctomycetes bacterium]|nr:EF2563 family selenium-dependent molybdenum hydroxylase system protein [Planctomycetota bacterium]
MLNKTTRPPKRRIGRASILVRGAGDFATGIIRRLYLAGFKVVATEIEKPLAIRRGVSFSESIYNGSITVEGVTAVCSSLDTFISDWEKNQVPVVIDKDASIRKKHRFDILVDARMMKKPNDTTINDAPVVIGAGPGFSAKGGSASDRETQGNCHAVIESFNGADLGRVIYKGTPAPYTGKPKENDLELCGEDFKNIKVADLVYFASNEGIFKTDYDIGDEINKGDTIARVGEENIVSLASGILRGILHKDVLVRKGTKLIEIDPTKNRDRCFKVSAKANALGGGVLEAVFTLLNKNILL